MHGSCRPIELLRRSVHGTLGLVFPPRCSYCDTLLDVLWIDPQLCPLCKRQIFSPSAPSCARCGAYFANRYAGVECRECRGKAIAFDGVLSLGKYEGKLQAAVVRMKYQAGAPLALALGRRLGEMVGRNDPADWPDLVTCVPKYWLKRLLTGINSAEILMSGLGKQANLPVAADLLRCQRRIRKQSLLSPQQRRRNVRGAWTINRAYDIRGAHVMVADDIMTTGATANEAARALKSEGADKVSLAVVGRAVKVQ